MAALLTWLYGATFSFGGHERPVDFATNGTWLQATAPDGAYPHFEFPDVAFSLPWHGARFTGRGVVDITAVPPVVTLRLTGQLHTGLHVNATDIDISLVGADGRASLLLEGATTELPPLGPIADRLLFGGGPRTFGLSLPLVLTIPDGRPACEGPPFAVARDLSVALFVGGSELSIGPAGGEHRYAFTPKKDGCKGDMFCGTFQIGPDGKGKVVFPRKWVYVPPIPLVPGHDSAEDLQVHLLHDLNGTLDVCSGRMDYSMASAFEATVLGHHTDDISVNCTLTTAASSGMSHTVQGLPIDDFGRGKIVAVSVVPKTGNPVPDRLLHLPTDAITEMPVQVTFDGCGWRQLRRAYCRKDVVV